MDRENGEADKQTGNRKRTEENKVTCIHSHIQKKGLLLKNTSNCFYLTADVSVTSCKVGSMTASIVASI